MSILIASIIVMGVLAVIFGLGLAFASGFCAVEVDPKVEAINEALPQINCGACGYKGCSSYAEAVAAGDAAPNKCVPGGVDTAQKLAQIMGVEVEATMPKRAVVLCQGGEKECLTRFAYSGLQDCHAAALVQGGPKACTYGCLGFGNCALVCPVDAVEMGDNGLPVIDPARCIACGLCVKECPRGIISLLPVDCTVYLGCSSHGRGKPVKTICSKGCIACQICVKKTESGAISMDDNLPVIDYDRGRDFDTAAEKCPAGCFVVQETNQATS